MATGPTTDSGPRVSPADLPSPGERRRAELLDAAEGPPVVVTILGVEGDGRGVRATGLLAPLARLWQRWRHGKPDRDRA